MLKTKPISSHHLTLLTPQLKPILLVFPVLLNTINVYSVVLDRNQGAVLGGAVQETLKIKS